MQTPAALTKPNPLPLDQRICWKMEDLIRATGLSRRTLQRAVAAKKLTASKIGKVLLFDPATVRRELFGERSAN